MRARAWPSHRPFFMKTFQRYESPIREIEYTTLHNDLTRKDSSNRISTCRCTLAGDGCPKGGFGTILVHFGDTFTTSFSHTRNIRWYPRSTGSAQEED